MPSTARGRACGIAVLGNVADVSSHGAELAVAYGAESETLPPEARARLNGWGARTTISTRQGLRGLRTSQTGQREGDDRSERASRALSDQEQRKWTCNLLPASRSPADNY
jgi:hypothetical protein